MSAMRDLAAGVYAIQGRFREAEYIYNTGIE